MASSNEEMNTVKFKIMLEETQEYLLEKSFGVYLCVINDNDYKLTALKSLQETLSCSNGLNISDNIGDDAFHKELRKVLKWLEGDAYLATNNGVCACADIKKNIIFWHLFMLSLDEKIYENEVSKVTDLAYCLGFNEVMIRDWCRAVDYVLAGNRLSEDCDLECETAEAKQYFKHSKVGINDTKNKEAAMSALSSVRKNLEIWLGGR